MCSDMIFISSAWKLGCRKTRVQRAEHIHQGPQPAADRVRATTQGALRRPLTFPEKYRRAREPLRSFSSHNPFLLSLPDPSGKPEKLELLASDLQGERCKFHASQTKVTSQTKNNFGQDFLPAILLRWGVRAGRLEVKTLPGDSMPAGGEIPLLSWNNWQVS